MIKYHQYKKIDKNYIKNKISEFLIEDMPSGDLTTENIIQSINNSTAQIQAVDELVFIGSTIIPHFFNKKCKIDLYKKDGELVKAGEVIAKIEGPTKNILSRERIMLNLIQRLCGIATTTKTIVNIAKKYNVKILDTRKTTPGLRIFEKYAVSMAGAYNHRLNLSDGILIKDNHLFSTGSIKSAIISMKSSDLNKPIELEVDNIDQIKEALKFNIEGFLLDNMTPNMIKKAVKLIRKSPNGGKKIFIEASGGITKKNITKYLNTGIDAISIGALTHSAISKDISLTFV